MQIKLNSNTAIYLSHLLSSDLITSQLDKKYATKKANWDQFEELLRDKLNLIENQMRCLTSTEELEKITQTLTETIIEACNETIPQTKSFKKSNNWWNEDINVKRKLVNRLRRLYQRTTNEELRDSRREEYFSERKLYQSMIRKSKFES